jgi:hypothetical protein
MQQQKKGLDKNIKLDIFYKFHSLHLLKKIWKKERK